jgi:gas vesicle protein
MDPNLDSVAQEIYGKIETRFRPIKFADEETKVLSKKTDIPKARWFEFDYKEDGETLGTITITLDEDDGVVIKAGGDLIDKETNETHRGAYKFIRSFRDLARRNLLGYHVDNLGKSNLDKRDYEFHAKDGEEKMMESKMFGTTKVSYQDLGEARLIVRHSQPVNFDLAAGRTMHIESIYIDNAQGERFRYPVKHLNGARAMAQHISHGGNPYDSIGQHIVGLSEETAKLRMFKNYVNRNDQLSEAMSEVNDKVAERIEQVKKEIHQLQRASHYEEFAENFKPRASQQIPETLVNDWIDRLTVRSFKEELKDVFPYIYSLVGEASNIGPDDLLAEKRTEEKDETGKVVKWKEEGEWKKSTTPKDGRGKVTNLSDKARRETEKMTKEEAEFLSFIDSLVEGIDDLPSLEDSETKDKLKDLMSKELKGFPNITDAVKAVYPDPTLLASLEDANPNVDARALVIEYFKNNHPEFYEGNKETFSNQEDSAEPTTEPAPTIEPTSTSAAEPAAEPNPEPAPTPDTTATAPEANPAAPMAESKIASVFAKAFKAGATFDTKIGDKTLGEMILAAGLTLEEFGMDPNAKPMAPATEPQGTSAEDMLKFASGFYNREQKNFTIGGTGVKAKIDKEFMDANPEKKAQVFATIDRIDPSSSIHQKERIKKLSGLGGHDAIGHAHGVMESYQGK